MLSWLKTIFSGGWVGLATTLGKAFNSAMTALQREQDRAAGHNEANLEVRVKHDEAKDRADAVYDGPSRGRIKRMRNKDVPPAG